MDEREPDGVKLLVAGRGEVAVEILQPERQRPVATVVVAAVEHDPHTASLAEVITADAACPAAPVEPVHHQYVVRR